MGLVIPSYAPLEPKISVPQIFQEFEEIIQGNDILSHFTWIDYFSFLKVIKEQ